MALFGSGRDANFVRLINKELINRVVDIEIEYYQLATPLTPENLYGESTEKIFYQPVRIPCLIDRAEITATSDEGGINFTRTSIFAFLLDTLKEKSVVATAGDYIKWDSSYYEIDNIQLNQYWGGKNPDTYPGNVFNETNEFGYNISLIAETHKTRIDRLNIEQTRIGINNNYYMPKNL